MDGRLGSDEERLVALAKEQDTASVKAIYDSHVQYLAAVCRRYVSSEDDVKDVLQESFVKIFSSLDRFTWQGEGSLKFWMRKIVVNESLMFLRRRSSEKAEAFSVRDDVPDVAEDEEPQVDNIPLDVLQRMIRSLPQGYRTVFNLYVFEQHSHKEIAALLGISENTSYSQFSRAKNLLARQIREYRYQQSTDGKNVQRLAK